MILFAPRAAACTDLETRNPQSAIGLQAKPSPGFQFSHDPGKPGYVGVGEETRRDELVHESPVGAELEIRRRRGRAQQVVVAARRDRRQLCPRQRGVADEAKLAWRQVRQQADQDGVGGV